MHSTSDPEFLKRLPSLGPGEIKAVWFDTLPDPRRAQPDQEAMERLNVCGILQTELRSRAMGSRNLSLLFEVQVMENERQIVLGHLSQKAAKGDPRVRAAQHGIELP